MNLSGWKQLKQNIYVFIYIIFKLLKGWPADTFTLKKIKIFNLKGKQPMKWSVLRKE